MRLVPVFIQVCDKCKLPKNNADKQYLSLSTQAFNNRDLGLVCSRVKCQPPSLYQTNLKQKNCLLKFVPDGSCDFYSCFFLYTRTGNMRNAKFIWTDYTSLEYIDHFQKYHNIHLRYGPKGNSFVFPRVLMFPKTKSALEGKQN